MNIELSRAALYAQSADHTRKLSTNQQKVRPQPQGWCCMHTIVPMTVIEARYFAWAQGGVVADASCDVIQSCDTWPTFFPGPIGYQSSSCQPETCCPDPVVEPAENPLGSRPGGDQEAPRPHSGAGPHQNCGAARRRAVQPSSPRFSRNHRRRKDVRPTGGRRRRRRGQRGIEVGIQGV